MACKIYFLSCTTNSVGNYFTFPSIYEQERHGALTEKVDTNETGSHNEVSKNRPLATISAAKLPGNMTWFVYMELIK